MAQDTVGQATGSASADVAGQANEGGATLEFVESAILSFDRWRRLVLGPLGAGLVALGIIYVTLPSSMASTTFMPRGAAKSALASLCSLPDLADGEAVTPIACERHLALMPNVPVSGRPGHLFKPLDAERAKYRVRPALEDVYRLWIPQLPDTAGTLGSVVNTAIYPFQPGQSLGDTLRLANRPTEGADKPCVPLVRDSRQVLSGRESSARLGHGSEFEGLTAVHDDTMFVPEETVKSVSAQAASGWMQVLSSVALAVPATRWSTRAAAQ